MNNKIIFAIAGESCTGKDTMVKILCKDDRFSPVGSYTDRPMRDNETDGIEHYFLSKLKFTELFNKEYDNIIAYTEIRKDENHTGYRYMALRNELEKHNVYIIDPNGLYTLRERCPDYKIYSILLTCPLEERIERSRNNRSDFDSEFMKRLENETAQFNKFLEDGDYDFLIDTSSSTNRSVEDNAELLRQFCLSKL